MTYGFMTYGFMSSRLTLALAATLAVAVPQIAQASCSGDACAAMMVIPVPGEGHYLTNQDDKGRKIRVTGCYLANGSCAASSNFDQTIDPKGKKEVKEPKPAANAKVDFKLDIKTVTFAGAPAQTQAGTAAPGTIKTVTVDNTGKMPLKVVILDALKFSELGRTSGFQKGSITVELKNPVGKYHWQVFRPGDLEPCMKKRDETRATISAGCDLPSGLKSFGQQWAGKCVPTGAGGPMATCCARQRTTMQLVCKDISDICDDEQKICDGLVEKSAGAGKR